MMWQPRTIVLYSVGLLGGSLGMALKTSEFTGRIIGLSSERNRCDALALGCVDEARPYVALQETIATADLLILCSPISAIIKQLRTLGTLTLPAGLVITDIGSTKKEICDAAKEFLPSHVHFIGGHPMAGSEKSGANAADPYLFQNALYALVSAYSKASELEEACAAFLKKHLGCRTLFIDAHTHDTIAATISHVPHLLAVALVNLAQAYDARNGKTLSLAAGGFRDMTRIAAAPYPMWHDILESNKGPIIEVLDTYCSDVLELKNSLIKSTLQAPFEAAQETRSSIKPGGKGFLAPLHEIVCLAKDHVGVLATITTLCAQASININDIEIMKVREGEGGTIRLGFSSHEAALAAIGILETHGFKARERE